MSTLTWWLKSFPFCSLTILTAVLTESGNWDSSSLYRLVARVMSSCKGRSLTSLTTTVYPGGVLAQEEKLGVQT